RSNSKRGVRIIPVDSGMGVEDWESKYKVPDTGVLDDYLDTEQKLWEDEDKSIIYRISDSCESKGSRFYQSVECDGLSPEETLEPNGRAQRHSFGSGEIRLVYKAAGSFEDESSPPEIDIIPSVKQLRQPTDRESLLYKTRLWAKTALEDTLENYAAFREQEAAREEAARIRGRIEYNSLGSDEMQYSFGSDEELEDLTFTEGEANFEYESYSYPGKYMQPFEGQDFPSKARTTDQQDPMLSPVDEPNDEYIDPVGELRSLVNSVSEYLAVKEEEINNYESMPKLPRRKLPALPIDAKILQPEDNDSNIVKPNVKEESSVEQGITGVKNAMSSLFSTFTGSKSPTEVEASATPSSPQAPQTDSGISKLFSFISKANIEASETSCATIAEPTTTQTSPQPESGISKLLVFIPKSGGTSPPVAIVPPACQEPATEKKFSIQSLLPFQSSEPTRQADANQTPTHATSEAQAGNQSTSGFESMLGRLSPLRLFSSPPSPRQPSPDPPEQRSHSAASKESQQGQVSRATTPNRESSQTEQQAGEIRPGSASGSVDLLPDTGSGSIELSQETGSGSVELLPETESSGELPDIQQRATTAVSEAKPDESSEEAGFFSPFKKSFSTLISTVPSEKPSHSDTKPAEGSFLGSKLKIPFFSENVSTATTPKVDGAMLSGILKLGVREDANVSSNTSPPTPSRSPSPSRASLLESVPKQNTGTGWFSNLFKVAPAEPEKEPANNQMTPTVTLTKPSVQTEPHFEQMFPDAPKATGSSAEQSYEEKTLQEVNIPSQDQDPHKVIEGTSNPETSQPQGILSGLLKTGQTESVSFDKKTHEGDSQSQQGGLFSGIFSLPSQPSPQPQQSSGAQQSGVFSGFLKLASDTVSASTNQSSPGGRSGQTSSQGQGLFSGLLKKAADTVTGSQPTQSSQDSQPGDANQTMIKDGSEQSLDQGSASPAESTGLLSGLKLGSTDSLLPDKGQTDQKHRQLVASDEQLKQPQQTETITQQKGPKPTTMSQSSGLLGGLLKLTESAPQQASSGQGGLLSGLFGISAHESAAVNPPKPSQNQPQTAKSENQPNQQPGNRQNLQQQNQTPPQQQTSGPGGMLSGLFNKITDVGVPQPTVGSQSTQQQAQRPGPKTSQQPPNQQGGFLSGLFSPGSNAPSQQYPPVNQQNQQQPQQGNRQPLRRQNQIPPQPPATVPEPQQGGLLSGLFNKLASSDNAAQQPSKQTGTQQGREPAQLSSEPLSQSSQQGGFLSGLFGQSPPQQHQAQQQTSKMAGPQQTTTQQANQGGGLLSGILKLASGDNVPQEQKSTKPPQVREAAVKSGQNQPQPESGGLISGLLTKISATVEQASSPSDQVTPLSTQQQQQQQQQQPRSSQSRPHIQRTKPVEVQSYQEASSDNESKAPPQKGFLSSLFSVTEEPLSKMQEPSKPQPGKEEPKNSTTGTSPGLLSGIFKTSSSDNSTSAPGKEKAALDTLLSNKAKIPSSTETVTTFANLANRVVDTHEQLPQSQVRQDHTVSPAQHYLEEIQRLLYGTADEYGYKDLLYNFTEHGVIPPELYDHQCLIEALLWQQLNDYVQAEALATHVQMHNQTCQSYIAPTVTAPQLDNGNPLNPKEMNISDFNVPAHPWRDAAAQHFESRNRFFETDEELVLFDMSCRNKKLWSSCDDLNDLDRNSKPWIARGTAMNLSMKKSKTRLSRCQSLTQWSVHEFSKTEDKCIVNNYLRDDNFDLKSATDFLKRLATKKGPVDLRRGALNLSKSAGAAGDTDEDMLSEDSEWYQQWLSLLEHGLWWPAEAGDCGYYVYTDENYIYSLLTDKAGRHLYACATEEEMQTLGNITENIANILKQNQTDKVTLCGFKIPLNDESRGFWVSDNQQNAFLLNDAPIDLTAALRKGEKIMNMNLHSFSQMFQESVSSQGEQPIDFSVYKLKKIKVKCIENGHTDQEEPIEAADFSWKSIKGGQGGPYWKHQGIKDTLTPGHLPQHYLTQISQNKQYPIPEIMIAHVDDTNADQSKQNASSVLSGIRAKSTNANTSRAETLSSTATTSASVGSKLSETSPSTSKIQLGRKLPPAPVVSVTTSSPTPPAQVASSSSCVSAKTSSPTVPSISSQRPHLTRQPSQADRQADKAMLLSQFNKSTVTGICNKGNSLSALSKTFSETPKEPQDTPKIFTPQLHILNNTTGVYTEAYLYNRNQKCFTTAGGSQMCPKVLDFSSAINKNNAKEKDGTDDSVESAPRYEAVDFTKYKLKRFREKMQSDTKANLDLTDKTTTAVDLTKQVEEEEVEWPVSECPRVSLLQDSLNISQTNREDTVDQQNQSARCLSRPGPETGHVHSLVHAQQIQAFSSTTKGAKTSGTDSEVSKKDKDASFKLDCASTLSSKSPETNFTSEKITPTAMYLSSKESNLDTPVKETARTESKQAVLTSTLLSPAMRKQVNIHKQQLPKQQSSMTVETASTPHVSSENNRSVTTLVSYQSCEKTQQYQKTTAPANSIKATLDMSVNSKTQPPKTTAVPTKDPAGEALSLTKRNPLAYVERDQSLSRQESIDLTCKAVVPVNKQEMNGYIHIPMTSKSFTSKEVVQDVDITSRKPLTDYNMGLSANAQPFPCQLDLKLLQQQTWDSKHDILSLSVHSPSLSSVIKQEHVTFPSTKGDNVLHMSPKPSSVTLGKTMPEDENATDEAVSLVKKSSERSVTNQDSVGVALIVDQTQMESTSKMQPQNVTPVVKGQITHRNGVSVTQQSIPSYMVMQHSVVVRSIVKSNSIDTAPANSVKGTLDMSTKTSELDTSVSSDPVPLVRSRRSSLIYSQKDSVGVPLIVETHLPQEQPTRNQTAFAESQKLMQRFVRSESGETTAPANSIRSFLDMSPKSQQKESETASITLSSGVVPLVRKKTHVTNNHCAGVPLIVEQHVCQQRRQVMMEVNRPETLHRQISSSHCNEVFSASTTIYKDQQQHNKPVDFSAKDSLATCNLSSNQTEPKNREPINFTVAKEKKETSEKRQTKKVLEKKTFVGTVDLTFNVKNKPIIDPQEAKNFTSVCLSSQHKINFQQQYVLGNTIDDVRNDITLSQTETSQQFREYLNHTHINTQPGMHYEMPSGTGLKFDSSFANEESNFNPERIQPPQPFAPQATQGDIFTSSALEQTSLDKPELPIQYLVSQHQCPHPGAEFTIPPPNTQKLQKQDTTIQQGVTHRPKILIKQATVDSYGSTEECEENGEVTHGRHSPVSCNTQQERGRSQTAVVPLSLKAQPGLNIEHATLPGIAQQSYGTSAAAYDAKIPYQVLKLPDISQNHTIAQNYDAQTLPSNNTDPIQCASQVSVSVSQSTRSHDTMPGEHVKSSYQNQGFSSQLQEPQAALTQTASSSVKGLISLFSNLDSQSCVSTKSPAIYNYAKTESKSVDHNTEVILTQQQDTHAPLTYNIKSIEAMASNSQIPTVSTFLPCTATLGQGYAESRPTTPETKLPSSAEASKDQSATVQMVMSPEVPLSTELQQKGFIPGDLSHKVSTGTLEDSSLSAVNSVSPSQEYQQPQETLNSCTRCETTVEELPPSKPLQVKPIDNKLHVGLQSCDEPPLLALTLNEAISKPTGNEVLATANEITSPQTDLSQQQHLEEIKQASSTELVNVSAEFGAISSQENRTPPRPIYLGIGFSDTLPFGVETDSGDQKPHVRLPHIFVSAASSPEEETNEPDITESSISNFPDISVPHNTTPSAGTAPEQRDLDVVKSDVSKDASALEDSTTQGSVETSSDKVKTCSPELPITLTTADQINTNEQDSQHTVTDKTSTDTTLSETENKADTTEVPEQKCQMISTERELATSDASPTDVKPFTELASQVVEESPECVQSFEKSVVIDENKSSGMALTEDVQCLNNKSLKEEAIVSDVKSPEGVQHLHDKSEKDVSSSVHEPPSINPPTEELTISKENSTTVKGDLPKAEQTDEQAGKRIFSMFSGSATSPQQTPSQTGISILGGIIPGTSTKDIPGTELLSMFGGSSAPSSSEFKETPLQSAPLEPQRKGLFSMFGGSITQPPPGLRGPTAGGVQPRGPPPKEPPGKGLFSMFGAAAPQQAPIPRGHPGAGPPPRGLSTGSSLFGGILPATQKDTPSTGLFSKFGGLGGQPQAGPKVCTPGQTESITSDLFGMFKGPETTKPEETANSGTKCGQAEPPANLANPDNSEKAVAESITLTKDGHVKGTEDSDLPEEGLVEEAETKDKAEEGSLTDTTVKTEETEQKHTEGVEHSEAPDTEGSYKGVPSAAPETKGIFDIPILSTPKFGFMSAATEGTPSIGSLFSTTSSASKTLEPQQTDGGLFSGFKSLSTGIFQDEKPAGKEETPISSSVFGLKLSSVFGTSDSPKPESTSPVITSQPQSESPKMTDKFDEPDSDKASPGSGETESADASDTEGPTETSKTDSCDTLAQTAQSGIPSLSGSLSEGLDKPQVTFAPCELDESEENTPATRQALLETEQLKDPLMKEAAKRLVSV
ncbi:hypothetical protein XENOCAPTIV_026576, partial [Xenoophorus captivus]